jgi:hypothetical protein
MAHTFCCTKPSVALAYFIVDCISQLNFYNYEHYEATRVYLGSARLC